MTRIPRSNPVWFSYLQKFYCISIMWKVFFFFLFFEKKEGIRICYRCIFYYTSYVAIVLVYNVHTLTVVSARAWWLFKSENFSLISLTKHTFHTWFTSIHPYNLHNSLSTCAKWANTTPSKVRTHCNFHYIHRCMWVSEMMFFRLTFSKFLPLLNGNQHFKDHLWYNIFSTAWQFLMLCIFKRLLILGY